MTAPLRVVLVGLDRTSAPVTEWPARLALTAGVLAVIAVGTWLMWRGWVARGRRQADLPAPPPVPADLGAVAAGPFEGKYLGSTTAGSWLDRVVAHGLGSPSHCRLTVHDTGVLLARGAAPDVFVPRADLTGVRHDKGIAGRAYGDDGIVVLTWRLGDHLLDTGIRFTGHDRHAPVVAAVEPLLVPTAPGGAA